MRCLGFLGVLVWWSTTAGAQPVAAPLAPPGLTAPGTDPVASTPVAAATEPEVVDYRWQIVLADATSVALVFSQNRVGATVGAFVYLLGGPVVHGANDEGARTAGSLAMRLGLPLVSALAGAELVSARSSCAADDIDCDSGALAGAVLGFGVGVLSAMVLDTALLARPHTVHRQPQRTWVPQFSVTPHQKTVGVLARF